MRASLRTLRRVCFAAAGVALAAAASEPAISVSFDSAVRATPATGRLVVYFISDRAADLAKDQPADGPFFDNPQPMLGADIRALAPGAIMTIDASADGFAAAPRALPPGGYRVQAVLDLHRDNSGWRREPGNLFSKPVAVQFNEHGPVAPIALHLTEVVSARQPPAVPGVEIFEVRSKLLSAFRGRDVVLRAGVVLPAGYAAAPGRRYAAVYEVPGFGGDHFSAFGHARRAQAAAADSPEARLRANSFWITLDPESGNGHTLFADSANNGPCGRALVEELIPALEARYRLEPAPAARLLRGHSSGGWSTLWLALNYSAVFGATWSSSPDPVDFRRFQLVDIYHWENMYTEPAGGETPSYRTKDATPMSIRQENLMEEVLGPRNASGQQWDSWQAVFGPRASDGNPVALYDAVTGKIDPAVATAYRAYDIAARLRAEPARYGPLFLGRVRLLVGGADSYYLNEAVALLKTDLEGLGVPQVSGESSGYVKILPGYDHGSLFRAPEIKAITAEMLAHLQAHALLPAAP